MSEDTRPGGPPEGEHHDHKLLELFERLVIIGEHRLGLRLSRITELLHSIDERDRSRRDILRGLWIAALGLLFSAAAAILVIGFKVWAKL